MIRNVDYSVTVSIIVPVYNTSFFLKKCVDSILSQSFQNFELILVDDGSTDESGKICNSYSGNEHVKVFHKQNGGRSKARNFGIQKSEGKYISFCDSDDWVSEFWLEHMLMAIGDSDMVNGGILWYDRHLDNQEYQGKPSCKYIGSQLVPKCEFSRFLYEYYDIRIGSSVVKLFKSSIIKSNNLFFDEKISYQEDLIFVLNYLKFCKSFVCIDKCDYTYNFYNHIYQPSLDDVKSVDDAYQEFVSDGGPDFYCKTLNTSVLNYFYKHLNDSSLYERTLSFVRFHRYICEGKRNNFVCFLFAHFNKYISLTILKTCQFFCLL
jgi:glycosyltransferase involved in cell wall biosynthesis